MAFTYLKFSIPRRPEHHELPKGPGSKIFETLAKPLSYLLPKVNPDFDGKIMTVNHWLLEFEDGNEIPSREIGLDENGRVLMIMPWKNNYGFWTDNNMTLDDFETDFHAQPISEEEFKKLWDTFESRLS